MTTSFLLIKRNVKLFFKDKGMFFTSLITPAILLILYVTFLGNVYRDNFTSNLPAALNLSERMIEGLVGGQLISSILAVSHHKRFANISRKICRAFAELLHGNPDFNPYHLLRCAGHLPCLCGHRRLVYVPCRCMLFVS